MTPSLPPCATPEPLSPHTHTITHASQTEPRTERNRPYPQQIWIPATFMNFAFSPMWLRIPVVASTSLVWTIILSSMRGGSEVPVEVG